MDHLGAFEGDEQPCGVKEEPPSPPPYGIEPDVIDVNFERMVNLEFPRGLPVQSILVEDSNSDGVAVRGEKKRRRRGQDLVSCDKCSFSTELPRLLKLHTRSTHGLGPSMGDLPRNSEPVQKKRRKQEMKFCDKCPFSSSNKTTLQNHLLRAHRGLITLKTCPHCPFNTYLTASLKTHVQTHLPPEQRSFRCSFDSCGYGTHSKRHLVRHLAAKHDHINPETELKKCPLCDYSTVEVANWKRHSQTHLPPEKKSYPCTFNGCSFGFTAKKSLNNHFARVHGETSHLMKCPHCEWSTSWSRSLKSHIQAHSEKKLFQCNIGDCTFSSETKLSLNIHTGRMHGESSSKKPSA